MHKLGFLKAIIVVSFVTVIMMSGYTIFFLSPSFTDLIKENTAAEATRVATYLSKLIFRDKTITDRVSLGRMYVTKENLPDNLAIEIEKVKRDFELIKVKIFSSTGRTVYSTDPKDIGKINTKPYFHDVVAKGRTYTRIVQKNTRSLEDQIVTADVVETYVPIMRKDNVIGAFEIYFDITAGKRKLDRLLARFHLISLALALSMLLVVTVISLKAIKSIIAQFSANTRDCENAHQRLITVLDR